MSVPYAEVIGDPITQSKSPLIHRFWLECLGLPGEYRAQHVRPDALADYLAMRRNDADWRGCNVTVPHKQAVMPLLDALSPDAEAIGAVNTVVREGERLVGHNTDASGFLEPLRPLLAERQLFRMARIIGAGGAARAVVYALGEQGFEVVLIARDLAKARAIRAGLGLSGDHVAPLEDWAQPSGFDWGDRTGVLDLVINTTSLGMTGQPPLVIDFSHVPPGAIVYDIVYAPLETPLLAAARAAGHRTIDGLHMLVGQAAAAFALFFGQPAPRQADTELRALLTA